MPLFQQILEFFNALLSWWFTVEPWEQAIRVRFGKNVMLFKAGLYWKIPFFDAVYKQNVRRRVSGIPIQTLTSSDGKSLTIYGSIGYKIADVLRLHMTLHDAELSVQQEVLGHVTRYVVKSAMADCTPKNIMEHVEREMHLEKYGLSEVEFFLCGYVADVPTYRILQDAIAPYGGSSSLSTQSSTPGMPR